MKYHMINNHQKKALSYAMLFFSVIYLLLQIFTHKSLYTKQYDPKNAEKKFYESQWSVPNSKKPISDEELYAYSGYRLINGGNPIIVNPETPPFGKYLIGFSILALHNERIISVVAIFLSIALVFMIVFQISKSMFAGALAVFLTAINSIFVDQLISAPQLDIQQLVFLLLVFLLIVQHEKNHKTIFLIGAGIAFGLYLSIKVFFISFLLLNAWFILYFFLKYRKILKTMSQIIMLNIAALTTYALTYFSYFLHGGTLRGFLGVQKWIVLFYSQSSIDSTKLFGNYLSLIFFNKWRFWSAGYPYVRFSSWSVLWPICFAVGAFASYQYLKSKSRFKNQAWVFISYLLIYNVFLFIVPVFPRYLVLLFVPMSIVIALFFDRILLR